MRCCKINLDDALSHGERSPRDDFWRAFEGAANRRRAIAARLRYLNGAEADPASLTPGRVALFTAERRFAMSAFGEFRRPE